MTDRLEWSCQVLGRVAQAEGSEEGEKAEWSRDGEGGRDGGRSRGWKGVRVACTYECVLCMLVCK